MKEPPPFGNSRAGWKNTALAVGKPGFVRIMVDLQGQLRWPFVAPELKVARISF
jgi:hypothetical protein